MDNLEYNYIKQQILKLTGVDLNSYKTAQVQRRLKTYLKRSGYTNWPKFFRTIQTTPSKLSEFKDYLTINVTAFFRDPEKFKYLETTILPELLSKRARLRVWSAGCSRGQEPYSLAILLAEATATKTKSPAVQVSNKAYQHYLLATDIDRSALNWAKARGPYTAEDLRNVSLNLRARYFYRQDNAYWIDKKLPQSIFFRQLNLLDNLAVGKFDLIVCRNVVIYFQTEAKIELYQRFYDALYPGGVLFVGGTEIIPKARTIGFEPVAVSFYRRGDK